MIERYDLVDARLALIKDAGGWQVLQGEVTLDAADHPGERTWWYPEDVFCTAATAGPSGGRVVARGAADLMLPRSCGHLIAWDDGSPEEFTSSDVGRARGAVAGGR